MASALQIINPTTGKGANRAKANGLTIGNQESFWLLELLKFRGFMEGAAPISVQESDDRKTYVIQPKQIALTDLQSMMKRFRAIFWSTTAVKLDILASLRFAQVFVEHYQKLYEEEDDPLREEWMSPELVSLARGFDVTFYKFLGSAHATMNIATIGFPAWLPRLEGKEKVEQADALLKEHIQLIRNIRTSKGEEGAEEYDLLRMYRDFLSSNDLIPFWTFAACYGGYLLHQREREKNLLRHIQQLHYQGLETIVMSIQPKLTAITRHQSFKRLAAAIRLSTVYPQRLKARGQDPVYEIRYGLGQDLLRKARHRQEFVVTLGNFLHSYCAENAREEERAGREGRKPKYSRVKISYDDIDAIVELIEQFQSSELIGTMLVACGYASDFPPQNQKNGAGEQTEQADQIDEASTDVLLS